MFVPLFFISGIVGKFISAIPFTLIFVLLASIFVALGLVPLIAILFSSKKGMNRIEQLQEAERRLEQQREHRGAPGGAPRKEHPMHDFPLLDIKDALADADRNLADVVSYVHTLQADSEGQYPPDAQAILQRYRPPSPSAGLSLARRSRPPASGAWLAGRSRSRRGPRART